MNDAGKKRLKFAILLILVMLLQLVAPWNPVKVSESAGDSYQIRVSTTTTTPDYFSRIQHVNYITTTDSFIVAVGSATDGEWIYAGTGYNIYDSNHKIVKSKWPTIPAGEPSSYMYCPYNPGDFPAGTYRIEATIMDAGMTPHYPVYEFTIYDTSATATPKPTTKPTATPTVTPKPTAKPTATPTPTATVLPSSTPKATTSPSTTVSPATTPEPVKVKALPGKSTGIKTVYGQAIKYKKNSTSCYTTKQYTARTLDTSAQLILPSFEMFTGGEFRTIGAEKTEDADSFIYTKEHKTLTFVSDYGAYDYMEGYINLIKECGFNVVLKDIIAGGGTDLQSYYLRYTGDKTIERDIGTVTESNVYIGGIERKFDLCVNFHAGVERTYVTLQYSKDITVDSSPIASVSNSCMLGSDFYPASNYTFFISGVGMNNYEYIDLEIKKSLAKKGATYKFSKIKNKYKSSRAINITLKNCTIMTTDGENYDLGDDVITNAKIKVLKKTKKELSLYYKVVFTFKKYATRYVYEGVASGSLKSGGGSGGGGIIPRKNACTKCFGMKHCTACGGRGGISYPTYGMGGSGWIKCSYCDGKKVCPHCGGKGEEPK